MSLDIGAFPPGRSKGPPVCSVAFEDDGYYWYLHGLFEKLRDETGVYVDLYGDATFGASHFARLKRLLDDASALVEAERAEWQVHVGTEVAPRTGVSRELFATVTKTEFRARLAAFRHVVKEAERLGGYVQCVGD